MLVRYDIGSPGEDYIRSILEEGASLGRQLAHALLKYMDLSRGSIYTYLPPFLDTESVLHFEHSILPLPEDILSRQIVRQGEYIIIPKASTEHLHLVPFVKEFLSTTPWAIAVFEDWLTEYGDGRPSDEVRRLVIGREICFYLLWRDADEMLIEKTIREVTTPYPPMVGILSSISESEAPEWERLEREGDEAEIESLARRTRFLIVGAYDGEGFLVWDRTG